MQPEPPLPVYASYNTTDDTFRVVFDRQLQETPVLDAANWQMTLPPATWKIGLAVQARGFSVFGTTQVVLGGPPASTISYSPPPSDVIGRVGGIAPGFAAFPMVVHP